MDFFQHYFVSLFRRDQSASATYYFHEKTESEKANENAHKTSASAQDNLVKEWMYYRSLQHGESEFPLRNKQVFLKSMCLVSQHTVMTVAYFSPQSLYNDFFGWIAQHPTFIPIYAAWLWGCSNQTTSLFLQSLKLIFYWICLTFELSPTFHQRCLCWL